MEELWNTDYQGFDIPNNDNLFITDIEALERCGEIPSCVAALCLRTSMYQPTQIYLMKPKPPRAEGQFTEMWQRRKRQK